MDDPADPVLLNTWKHHARWIRWRIRSAAAGGSAGVEALVREMAVVGSRLMDLYTGSLTPTEIGAQVGAQLRDAGRFEFEPLSAFLQGQGEYAMHTLTDGSQWTVRLGPADGRYLHLHPGRWVPHTIRVQANTLRSAVVAHAYALVTGGDPMALSVVNEARGRYLEMLPVRELTGDGGLGAVIAALAAA